MKLKRSEERYRFLFLDHPIPAFIFDLDSNMILEVNNAAVKQYGYSREEFIQLSITDIEPQGEQNPLIEPERIMKDEVYTRHMKKGGALINVWLKVCVLNEGLGNQALATVVDISSQLQELESATSTILEADKRGRWIVAREMHDDLIQNLAITSMLMESVSERSGAQLHRKDKRLIQKAKSHLKEAIQIGRDTSSSLILKTIKDDGLVAALTQLIHEFMRYHQEVSIEWTHTYTKNALLVAEETHLFRIISEALSSSFKYRGARRFEVSLLDDGLVVSAEISDDGRGSDLESTSALQELGLKSIRNRANSIGASFSIQSGEEKGITVGLRLLKRSK